MLDNNENEQLACGIHYLPSYSQLIVRVTVFHIDSINWFETSPDGVEFRNKQHGHLLHVQFPTKYRQISSSFIQYTCVTMPGDIISVFISECCNISFSGTKKIHLNVFTLRILHDFISL